MNSLTLIKPGLEPSEGGSVTIDFAGDGVVLETHGVDPVTSHYFPTNQEAKEFIIKAAYALINLGWRVYTGDGVVE